MSHVCHAYECNVAVPPALFMCRNHWYSLPKPLRDAVLREYRPGQERTKDPSLRYLAVTFHCIARTAFKPNDEAAARTSAHYLELSEEMRGAAISDGVGDPLVFLEGAA